jgi:dihydrofolate synthase/folylpolyglutamate synthase
VLADKDYGEMFRPVMDKVAAFVCITPDNPRRLPAHELAAHLRAAGAEAVGCNTVKEAVETAKAMAGETGAVLCFGSLYSIGAIKDAL